jgi:thioredoxin 1
MKQIIELTEDKFEAEVVQANLPVVVDFYAPWCGPCKMIAPIVEQLAVEYSGRLKFAKANVDETPQLAARFRIEGVPTLLLFRNGNYVDEMVGFPGLRALKLWLDRAAETVASTQIIT